MPDEERDLVVRRTRRRRLDYSAGIVDELLSPSLAGALELLAAVSRRARRRARSPIPMPARKRASSSGAGSSSGWTASFLLEAGDSFGFPSSLPHRYRNPGPEETEVIWAITPPSY